MNAVEWRAIPGWEGCYEVSNAGQVRGVTRVSPIGRRIQGKTLAQTLRGFGYQYVSLRRDSGRDRALMTVHKAVALAFIGPRPNKHEVRHLDGNPLNNHASNLAYGTRSENNLDAVQHGTNLNAAKTHCVHGHPLAGPNLKTIGRRRICRTCETKRKREWEARNKIARNSRPRRAAA